MWKRSIHAHSGIKSNLNIRKLLGEYFVAVVFGEHISIYNNMSESNRTMEIGGQDESGLEVDQINFGTSLKTSILEEPVPNRSI